MENKPPADDRQNSDRGPWILGILYFNPADPALFVKKRFGIGETVNFGNRWAWIIAGIFAIVVLAPAILYLVLVRTR